MANVQLNLFESKQLLGVSRDTRGIQVNVEGRKFKSIKAAARYYGRSYTHIFERLKNGCTIEQALGLVKRTDTLLSENPNLAKEWHPTKNSPLTARKVTPGSGIKAWWICQRGHEWQAVINSRNRGCGCPHCAGQRPTAERNFAVAYPELLEELDWEKNKGLDPLKLTPRANQKVWWKCEKGHSWEATITNKTRVGTKGDCPYCLKRKLCDDNSLAKLRPDIAQDWHPTKNKGLTPKDVVAGGYTKVWWICKHSHEWQNTVGARVNSGTGCPHCHLQTSRIEIAVYSEILALFSNVLWREKIDGYECDIFLKTKNIGIEIDGVRWHKPRVEVDLTKQKLFGEKGIQLFRLREEGLELLSERDISFKWSDDAFPIVCRLVKHILKFAKLDREERCRLEAYAEGKSLVNEKRYRQIVAQLPAPPLEQSLAVRNPEIAKEWAFDLNAPLSPEHFRPSASKAVWWRCQRGHVWKASLNNRTSRGGKCRACPRPTYFRATKEWNLAATNPELISEWHYEKNGRLLPEGITPKSNYKVWWKCKGGHEWQATPSGRTNGTGCPSCSGRVATKENNLALASPEILLEWDHELNKGLNPADFKPRSSQKMWWRCLQGHSWQAAVYNRTKMKSGCPACARKNARKHSIEFFQKFASERGGECLSIEFISVKKKLKMKCIENHVWEMRADSILDKNRWCPTCSK